ncbi:MAG: hypothetical protein M3P89_00320, partial [Actinomycetota bacterium]|nr:hypothetical protein [Actinomycetota bacterium]
TARGGDRRSGRHDGGPAAVGSGPLHHGPLVITEVADSRHPGAQLLLLRCGENCAEFGRGQLGDLLERAGAAVAAEVDVGCR